MTVNKVQKKRYFYIQNAEKKAGEKRDKIRSQGENDVNITEMKL